LPASAWPEKDGTVTNTNRQVQIGAHRIADAGRWRSKLGDSIQNWRAASGSDWNTRIRATSSPR